MELHPLQQAAIDLCLEMKSRLVAVSGAAGTGKTTIIRMVYNKLKDAGYSVVLCAPTGKAAKRIYEATGIPAMTIHRLLEYTHPGDINPKTGKPEGISYPRKTRQEPLGYDVIIGDEYAMVPEELHRNLIDAIPSGGVVRLFGDDNQLSPIEEYKSKDEPAKPSQFVQVLKNDKLPSIILETVFRQGTDSGILLNATNLLKGRVPTKNEQWSQKITDKPTDELVNYLLECDEQGISFVSPENQIIVPQKKSWVGSDKLNPMIQGLFFNEKDNPECIMVPRKDTWAAGKAKPTPDLRMFVGDKVIFTVNNTGLSVFNGEVGVIKEIEHDLGEIIVDFGDREQSIPCAQEVLNRYGKMSIIDPRKDLDLAYAITTHKSQGSEYKRLVYIMNKSNSYMLSRRNFYTAVTRAKEHVHIIADQVGLSMGVNKRD